VSHNDVCGHIDLFVLSILSGRTSKTEFVCKSYGQLKFAVENRQNWRNCPIRTRIGLH
jgi:hypothetical protein